MTTDKSASLVVEIDGEELHARIGSRLNETDCNVNTVTAALINNGWVRQDVTALFSGEPCRTINVRLLLQVCGLLRLPPEEMVEFMANGSQTVWLQYLERRKEEVEMAAKSPKDPTPATTSGEQRIHVWYFVNLEVLEELWRQARAVTNSNIVALRRIGMSANTFRRVRQNGGLISRQVLRQMAKAYQLTTEEMLARLNGSADDVPKLPAERQSLPAERQSLPVEKAAAVESLPVATTQPVSPDVQSMQNWAARLQLAAMSMVGTAEADLMVAVSVLINWVATGKMTISSTPTPPDNFTREQLTRLQELSDEIGGERLRYLLQVLIEGGIVFS